MNAIVQLSNCQIHLRFHNWTIILISPFHDFRRMNTIVQSSNRPIVKSICYFTILGVGTFCLSLVTPRPCRGGAGVGSVMSSISIYLPLSPFIFFL